MRIDRLTIKQFKNLNNFTIDFDVNNTKQVLIGRNGVGKSNLLEAITIIFKDLDLMNSTEFEYIIEYQCNKKRIKVTNDRRLKKDEKISYSKSIYISDIDDNNKYKKITLKDFEDNNRPIKTLSNPRRLLPSYVFGYYSGVLPRYNSLFKEHENNYYSEQKNGIETALRPLFLAQPHHSQFALLSFFASKDKQAIDFLKNEFGILGIESVLFTLQEPTWNKKAQKSAFWNAGGKVAPFLDDLFNNSFAPMSGSKDFEVMPRRYQNKEVRYCFIPDEEALYKIAKDLDPKEFFARLDSLAFSELIGLDCMNIQIKLKMEKTSTPITFLDLSEGERQLITILGLMRFTGEQEGLFLLDEPDTHQNPAWCIDYLSNLEKYGAEPKNSQVIITTHSPLTFAGLEKEEVIIIQNTEEGYVYSYHPTSSPKGMGFEAILTSDFFGLRSTLDRETLKLLDEKRYLAFKETRSEEETNRLIELDKLVQSLDFSNANVDPLYYEYVKAMTKIQEETPDIKENIPTDKVRKKREMIAQDIVTKIKELGLHL